MKIYLSPSDQTGNLYSAGNTNEAVVCRKIAEAAGADLERNGYEVMIIAGHGNAVHALNDDGTPNTAHSLNPVPFVYVTENKDAKVENGVLADVAPSILHILGMAQPADMAGHGLIK